MEITQQNLRALIDFKAAIEKVRHSIEVTGENDKNLIRYFARYTAWNMPFGSGVASLAAKMSRASWVFRDPTQQIDALADRSVIIASYVFDAARDEYNDHTLPHRATHRCLAQAMLGSMINRMWPNPTPETIAEINIWLKEPMWLLRLEDHVAIGYGHRDDDALEPIFKAIGFHLGSELLADMEFSVLDQYIHDRRPDWAQWLNTHTFLIGKHRQEAMKWLSIHSGHGGGVEADHFLWATKSATRGLEFVSKEYHERAGDALKEGFISFVRDHDRFFSEVNESHE